MDVIQPNNTMNMMAWAVAKLLGLYLVVPMILTGVVAKAVGIKGKLLNILVGASGLIGLYFMFYVGIDSMSK